MIATISAQLADLVYITLISDPLYSPEMERKSIETALSRMPEAVILSPANPKSKNLLLLEPLFDRTLVLGDVSGIAETSSVSVAHRKAGFLSADHMLTFGSRDLLIFGGPEGYQSSDLFLAGVTDAYTQHGLTPDESKIFHFKPDQQAACSLFTRLWTERPGLCSGVIFSIRWRSASTRGAGARSGDSGRSQASSATTTVR